MSTDLARHIQDTAVVDTHEHLQKEYEWVSEGPGDVLADLFTNYVPADLVTAGASPEAMRRLTDAGNPDIEGRWAGVEKAFDATRFTGYGEAVRILAKEVYGIERITAQALRDAQPTLDQLRQPGGRLQLLRDRANLDHTQTDDFCYPCLPDESGPDFFLYDLSWRAFCSGQINQEELANETGMTVKDLATLRQAMEGLFDKYAPCAIAVKSQHAYGRTLRWEDRTDADAARALQKVLTGEAGDIDVQTSLCLGDWCWARGVELAIKHNLPFKLHTGYYAGNNYMVVDRIKAGNLCPLLIKYPEANFVLMHASYPYNDELIALTKHFSNVWADMCWAWSISPRTCMQFVRQFLHTAPANKLFAFGGDTGWPTSSFAYAIQMRKWLTRALEAEVAEGDLTEAQAIDLATRLMRGNQLACFDVQGTRRAITEALTSTTV